jgi:CRISPR-associated protein Cas2
VVFGLDNGVHLTRRVYARFRKHLLRDGFAMMQYSVYIRHCASEESTAVQIGRVERRIPDDGEVRMLTVTDKQFERMRVFWGKRRQPPERAPVQLELF